MCAGLFGSPVERLDKSHHERLVLGRPFGINSNGLKSRETHFAHASGGSDHLALGLDLGEDGVPNKSGVDIAPLPSGGNFRWTHVHHIQLFTGHAIMLECRHQLVVCGGDKWHTHALALEVLEAVDSRAIASHQRFGISNVGRNPERLDVLPLAGSRSKRTGPHLPHLHISRRHGANDVATAREHAPVDFVARGLFHLTRFHDQTQRHQHILMRKRHRLFLRMRRAERQQAGYRGDRTKCAECF